MSRPSEGPNVAALRQTLGCFVTGVTVVTTRAADGTPYGFTANSFTSVSLDPPLVLVCVGQAVRGVETFRACERFAINILSDSQQEVSRTFANGSPSRFSATGWRDGRHGQPIMEGGVAWLECEAYRRLEAGDHMILVGRVLAHECSASRPLVYYRGGYSRLASETGDREARPEDAVPGGPAH